MAPCDCMYRHETLHTYYDAAKIDRVDLLLYTCSLIRYLSRLAFSCPVISCPANCSGIFRQSGESWTPFTHKTAHTE